MNSCVSVFLFLLRTSEAIKRRPFEDPFKERFLSHCNPLPINSSGIIATLGLSSIKKENLRHGAN